MEIGCMFGVTLPNNNEDKRLIPPYAAATAATEETAATTSKNNNNNNNNKGKLTYAHIPKHVLHEWPSPFQRDKIEPYLHQVRHHICLTILANLHLDENP